ncbi:right-handed parallel beta-helix repeat-containing protein [Streptomyces sp. NPDC047886]|uniref:right-handed parallel beta-helix repeat-containing protein n=1 Tax=Streptomyces sp. NPDC047886 TaxID=3365490 RepID=UPI00371C59BA
MSHRAGCHRRRTRTLTLSAAIAVSAGAAGVWLGLTQEDARAVGTVVVSDTAALRHAVANATAGTTIQIRGGTYYPTSTLTSTANGTATHRITLMAYGSEQVRIDGSGLPSGSSLAGLHGDHWTVRNIRFQNAPAQGFVATSSVGGIFENLVTNGNGGSGFTLRGDGTSDNLIRNLDSYGNYDAANHGQNADGLAITFGSGTNNKVTGARLFDNADDGLDLWQWAGTVTIEHTWAFGNGENRWNDPAFEGEGNGFALGGGGATAAHLVTASAAWDNARHGFTGNGNTGAISLNRNTTHVNEGAGFSFTTGAARLAGNLAVSDAGGRAGLGPGTVSARNNWDSGVATPPFRSTDASRAYGARGPDGSLPATTFLTTGSTSVGATMG